MTFREEQILVKWFLINIALFNIFGIGIILTSGSMQTVMFFLNGLFLGSIIYLAPTMYRIHKKYRTLFKG